MEENQTTSTVETTTETSAAADNSQQDAQEINEPTLQEQISKALDEPDTMEEEGESDEPEEKEETKPEQEEQDNSINCPDKFKNKDGSVNVNNLLKSYTDLESYSTKQKNDWEKERAELLKVKDQLDEINKMNESKAREAGYESAQDMQQVYDIAYAEANEYAKYLQYTDDPEEVRNMLINYANNPTSELMEKIELEFAPEVNKRVAIASDRLKQQFENQRQSDANTIKMYNIESVVNESVKTNRELFNYEPFKELFVNTLEKYGDNFSQDDANALMETMIKMKDLYKAEFEKQYGIKQENNKATDKISAMNGSSSAPVAKQLSNEDIGNLSSSELRKEIRKYL